MVVVNDDALTRRVLSLDRELPVLEVHLRRGCFEQAGGNIEFADSTTGTATTIGIATGE